MIDQQLAIYSSLVFQWIIIAAILLVCALFINRKLSNVAKKINQTAVVLDKQITETGNNLCNIQKDIEGIEKDIDTINQTISEGNQTLEEVSNQIHDIVLKLNQSIESIIKIKQDFLTKIKF